MYVKGKTWPTTQSMLKLMIISVEQKDLFINRGFFAVRCLRVFEALKYGVCWAPISGFHLKISGFAFKYFCKNKLPKYTRVCDTTDLQQFFARGTRRNKSGGYIKESTIIFISFKMKIKVKINRTISYSDRV